MLAKIKGAPAGVKGISLFVVPKKRIDEKGQLVFNDVVTSGIFHKLGYEVVPLPNSALGTTTTAEATWWVNPIKDSFICFR